MHGLFYVELCVGNKTPILDQYTVGDKHYNIDSQSRGGTLEKIRAI